MQWTINVCGEINVSTHFHTVDYYWLIGTHTANSTVSYSGLLMAVCGNALHWIVNVWRYPSTHFHTVDYSWLIGHNGTNGAVSYSGLLMAVCTKALSSV